MHRRRIVVPRVRNVPQVRTVVNSHIQVTDVTYVDETKGELRVSDDFEDLGFDESPEIGDSSASVVEDSFTSATKYCFLGLGQGGSRLVEAFFKLGYKRSCVINTAKQDLDEIDLPNTNKCWLETNGAAKNRQDGRQMLERKSEQVLNTMRRSFGSNYDCIIIVASAGGGTGSGSFPAAVELAARLNSELRITKPGDKSAVGVMLVIPSNSEKDSMNNTFYAIKDAERLLESKTISTLILPDNEKIGSFFPRVSYNERRKSINMHICGIFHRLNRLSASKTADAIDPADYRAIMGSGFITYSQVACKSPGQEDLTQAFSKSVKDATLNDYLDPSTTSLCAAYLIGRDTVIDGEVIAEDLDSAYDTMYSLCGGPTVHRGVYKINAPLTVCVLLGGLKLPSGRLREIAIHAGFTDWDS